MAFVFACEFPDDLWFDVERDVWIGEAEGGLVRMGMTDPAQTRAGRILFVRARAGKHVESGKSIATVESAKWVGPVPSPLAGTVSQANQAVLADPTIINRDPYGAGWLVQFRPDGSWHDAELLHGEEALVAYRLRLKSEGLTCMRCADQADPGDTPPDAGFYL